MANNTQLNLGVGGDTMRDIDKGGVKTPVSIIDLGGSGAENLVTAGQTTMANSLPVVIASNQTAVPSSNAAATQADGHSATIGATTDASSANTLVGLLKAIKSFFTAGVGSRLDVNAYGAAGDVASGSADSGNPVKVGGKAVSAEPAALTTGQRSNFLTDLVGKLINLPYCNPEQSTSNALGSDLTNTTPTSLLAAPGAGLRTYITQLFVSNMHASVSTRVDITDGSGGALIYTGAAVANGGGYSINFVKPLRQPTTNTAIFIVCGTTGAQVRASIDGYKGV